ncbi:MAG: hypothetical protein V1688_03770 [bacterium]
MCKKTKTFYLFARPSFVSGMAGVLDLGANLQFYNESETAEDADNIALLNDWKQVGNDLKIAIKKYERARQ